MAYYVITTATTSKIPNLTAQGLPLPAATAVTAQVVAVGPYSSVDALAGRASLVPPSGTFAEGFAAPIALTTQ